MEGEGRRRGDERRKGEKKRGGKVRRMEEEKGKGMGEYGEERIWRKNERRDVR